MDEARTRLLPHLRKRHGIWECRDLEDPLLVGYGYTPKQAYDEWRTLV